MAAADRFSCECWVAEPITERAYWWWIFEVVSVFEFFAFLFDAVLKLLDVELDINSLDGYLFRGFKG